MGLVRGNDALSSADHCADPGSVTHGDETVYHRSIEQSG